ncbi:MAG: NAD(P)-binding protein, partial [Lachnospiraceae bacterium]|nr:NAD(P)-binding protein [Lachnospiraceae bacterium]
MILISQLKIRWHHDLQTVKKWAAKALMVREEELLSFEILRRSLDCRKKPELYYVYSVEVSVKEESKVLGRAKKNPKAKEQFAISERVSYRFPNIQEGVSCEGQTRPIVVGAGPAGLFCAYYLALAGLRPLLLERGRCVEERTKDVENFWETGRLDPSSNVQFGEGGAGTFSDGKLNTLVKDKEGRNRAVLETFVKFGAKESILYDAKPHVGTDELAKVVKNMREELIRLGAEVRFESQVTGIESNGQCVTAVVVNKQERIPCEHVVLAIGHSARDTFEMLLNLGLPMEAKPFAVGFRVEHPQEMINESQYGMTDTGDLETAAYKVTAKAKNGRAVYSFCMCPGGYVVNASSEEGRLAVNGMSYSGRDGKNANSAIIVAVTPEDYPGNGPLAGIAFQRELEEKAYRLGGGKIPMQRYGEYRRKILCMEEISEEADDEVSNDEGCSAEDAQGLFAPCMKGLFAKADLSSLLPKECGEALVDGMLQFGRQIKGFDREDAILSGVESR